ncbi:hypothetical protein T484DRAFT_1857607, partial [Baffinella frigidus]
DVPYEETAEELTCPPQLAKLWRRIWEKTKGFEAATALLENAEEDDTLLQDTLWRVLLLFAHDSLFAPDSAAPKSPILAALVSFTEKPAGKREWADARAACASGEGPARKT